jgi:hypothetical protein
MIVMDATRYACRLFCTLALVSAASTGGGCSMFKPVLNEDPRAEVVKDGGSAAAAPMAKYAVELHPESGQPTRVQRALTGTVTTQQALKETEALEKFRRSKIELHRSLANGAVHRMTVEYDRGKKLVAPEFDYALQPGDRLIVKEDPSTVFDDMLEQTLGQYNPLGSGGSNGRTKSGGFYRVAD